MTAHTTIKAGIPEIDAILAALNDQGKLMLIDYIADTFDDDLNDDIDLAVAFERVEAGYTGELTPIYPAGAFGIDRWKNWRLQRDQTLAAMFKIYGIMAGSRRAAA